MNDYVNKKPFRDQKGHLSKKDRVGYILIYILLFLFDLFSVLVYLSIKSTIVFWDERAFAFSESAGKWQILPFGLFVLANIIYTDANYRLKNIPLFKGKQKYNVAYHSSKKEHVAIEEKKKRAKRIIVWFLSLIICVSVSLFGLFSREVMDKDGTLYIYNSFNAQTASLSVDDVVSLSINATKYMRRRGDETDLWLTVNYKNGKECIFNTDSFIGSDDYSSYTDSLKGLIKIKELLKDKPLTINGSENLDEVAEYFEISADDMHLLYELFEAT